MPSTYCVQLTRDLFAIAKFLLHNTGTKQVRNFGVDRGPGGPTVSRLVPHTPDTIFILLLLSQDQDASRYFSSL